MLNRQARRILHANLPGFNKRAQTHETINVVIRDGGIVLKRIVVPKGTTLDAFYKKMIATYKHGQRLWLTSLNGKFFNIRHVKLKTNDTVKMSLLVLPRPA
jgi:hypothetical protein